MLAVVLIGALCAAVAWAEVPVPEMARVNDAAQLLSPDQRDNVEKRLAWLEQRKGAQIAVLTVPTTQPETVEQFATRVFARWRLGRAGVDDGILLLVAKDDRKLRIEVGRGLEGAVPDLVAKHVIDAYITPKFRDGYYYDGIDTGVDCLIHLIDGEPLPAPQVVVVPQRDLVLERVAAGSGNPADLDSYLAAYLSMLVFITVLQLYLVRLAKGLRVVVGALITVLAVGWYWFGLPSNVLGWSLLGTVLLGLLWEYGPRGGSSGTSESGSSGWSSGGWSGGGGESAGGGASGSW